MNKNACIYVAGHHGMVGSAILQQLKSLGFNNLLTAGRTELDLINQASVADFMHSNKPEIVLLCAAKVGGIHANSTYPADFIYNNLMIQNNVIHQAHAQGVKQLLFLGSSCIYPRDTVQPIAESSLLTGALEPTNEPYAVAKIAGIKLCESYNRQYGTDFRSIMPTNLYGHNDNFHPENSHVIPALMRRLHEAKLERLNQVSIWGNGEAKREFLYIDDMADAALHLMQLPKADYQKLIEPTCSHINIGTGQDCSIRELSYMLKDITGYQGELTFDTSKPNGTPRKLLDTRLLNQSGWQPATSLPDGLKRTYHWFSQNFDDLRI